MTILAILLGLVCFPVAFFVSVVAVSLVIELLPLVLAIGVAYLIGTFILGMFQ